MLVVLSFAIFFVQCTFLKALVGIQPRNPKVHLVKLQVHRADLKSIEMTAQLLIQNPNDFELRFSDVHYQLNSHDKLLAEGTYTQEMVIQASTATTLYVPIQLQILQAAQVIQDFLKEGKALIKWTADANFISPLGGISIHLADEKELK